MMLHLLVPASLLLGFSAAAADHADSPLLLSIPRHDARISDLHAFTAGDALVLAMCTDPSVPNASSYVFPEDLTVRFDVDIDSEVSFADAQANAVYGGTIVHPDRVSAEVVVEVTFDALGAPSTTFEGLAPDVPIALFAGLRDDPFIRRPRTGANSPCVVLELPLDAVVDEQSTLLVWGSTKVPDVTGAISEHGGRALRSMFSENDAMNTSSPRDHHLQHGLVPDVIVYDTSAPAAFPNGRALTDDVVDLVDDPRVNNASEGPDFPTENDVPFLSEFPYLAPPHAK